MGTKLDDGDQSRLVRRCAGGAPGAAAMKLKVMRSRFESRGGRGRVRVGRGAESGWHAGGHRFPPDELKCVQACVRLGLPSATAK